MTKVTKRGLALLITAIIVAASASMITLKGYAAGTLSSSPIGTKFKLEEDGTLYDWTLISHNYEGTGNQLLIRDDTITYNTTWSTHKASYSWDDGDASYNTSAEFAAYNTSEFQEYLNNDYITVFKESIQDAIVPVSIETVGSIRCINSTGSCTFSKIRLTQSIFILSLKEMTGISTDANTGVYISYFSSNLQRKANNNYTLRDYSTNWYTNGSHYGGSIGCSITGSTGAYTSGNVTTYRPCLVLPGDTAAVEGEELIGSTDAVAPTASIISVTDTTISSNKVKRIKISMSDEGSGLTYYNIYNGATGEETGWTGVSGKTAQVQYDYAFSNLDNYITLGIRDAENNEATYKATISVGSGPIAFNKSVKANVAGVTVEFNAASFLSDFGATGAWDDIGIISNINGVILGEISAYNGLIGGSYSYKDIAKIKVQYEGELASTTYTVSSNSSAVAKIIGDPSNKRYSIALEKGTPAIITLVDTDGAELSGIVDLDDITNATELVLSGHTEFKTAQQTEVDEVTPEITDVDSVILEGAINTKIKFTDDNMLTMLNSEALKFSGEYAKNLNSAPLYSYSIQRTSGTPALSAFRQIVPSEIYGLTEGEKSVASTGGFKLANHEPSTNLDYMSVVDTSITENGVYYAFVKDMANRISSAMEFEVTNFDETAPVINTVVVPENWVQEAIVEIEAYDPISSGDTGIEKYAVNQSMTVPDEDSELWSDTKQVRVNANGNYIAWVKDKSGNVSSQSFYFGKLDTVNPVISNAEFSSNGLTLNVRGYDAQSGIKFIYINGVAYEGTTVQLVISSSNTRYVEIVAEDASGRTSETLTKRVPGWYDEVATLGISSVAFNDSSTEATIVPFTTRTALAGVYVNEQYFALNGGLSINYELSGVRYLEIQAVDINGDRSAVVTKRVPGWSSETATLSIESVVFTADGKNCTVTASESGSNKCGIKYITINGTAIYSNPAYYSVKESDKSVTAVAYNTNGDYSAEYSIKVPGITNTVSTVYIAGVNFSNSSRSVTVTAAASGTDTVTGIYVNSNYLTGNPVTYSFSSSIKEITVQAVNQDNDVSYPMTYTVPDYSNLKTAAEQRNSQVKITITAPTYVSGNSGVATVGIRATCADGIQEVLARTESDTEWIDITDEKGIEIYENTTVYVKATSDEGASKSLSQAINCFDSKKPVVSISQSGSTLYIRATDYESGISRVYVNSKSYDSSALSGGRINYIMGDNENQFAIYAIDKAGNTSDTLNYARNSFGYYGEGTTAGEQEVEKVAFSKTYMSVDYDYAMNADKDSVYGKVRDRDTGALGTTGQPEAEGASKTNTSSSSSNTQSGDILTVDSYVQKEEIEDNTSTKTAAQTAKEVTGTAVAILLSGAAYMVTKKNS